MPSPTNTNISNNINPNNSHLQKKISSNNSKKPFILIGLDLFEYDGSSYISRKTSGKVFLKNEARYIGAMLMFDKPVNDTDIEVKWQIFNENGTSFTKEMVVKGKITQNNTGFNVSWGWANPGNWPIGRYRIVARANDSKEWSESFEVINGYYNHPTSPPLNNFKLFNLILG